MQLGLGTNLWKGTTMTASIRPSLILHMDIDASEFSEDLVAEFKRSYSHVAAVKAAAQLSAPESGPASPSGNMLTMEMRLHRPSWDAADAQAAELWSSIMPTWLHNKFRKLSATITGFNDVQVEAGRNPIHYAWISIDLDDGPAIAFAANTDSSIPDNAIELIEAARSFTATGALGEGAAAVYMPSCDSLRSQYAAGSEADELSFDVDRSLWSVAYADGTVRLYDSNAEAFVD